MSKIDTRPRPENKIEAGTFFAGTDLYNILDLADFLIRHTISHTALDPERDVEL